MGDLGNNTKTIIRKSNNAKHNNNQSSLKCPECLFKIAANTKICNICNTSVEKYVQQKLRIKEDDVKQNDEKPKSEPKSQPDLKDDEVVCPQCNTQNSKDFNFCVGCSFDLRKINKIMPKHEPDAPGNPFD